MQGTVPEHIQREAGAVMEQMGRYHPSEPHWYLPLIGIDPAQQGKGYGGALLQHALIACDRDGSLAYLESTNPRNIPLYERHGFETSRHHPGRQLAAHRSDAAQAKTEALMLKGGCYCGAVRYEVAASPARETACHCSICRGTSGAPFVAWFSVPAASFRVVVGPAGQLQVIGTCHADVLPYVRNTPDVPVDAPSRRDRRYDLLPGRSGAGAAQGPYLRVLQAVVGEARRRASRLSGGAQEPVISFSSPKKPRLRADEIVQSTGSDWKPSSKRSRLMR